MERLSTLSAEVQLSILGHIATRAEWVYWAICRSIPLFRRSVSDESSQMKYLSRFGYKVYHDIDSTYWNRYAKLHRIDGPAIMYEDGSTEWYQNDKLHRDHGPACISSTSVKWYQRGERHRDGGPAIVSDGLMGWYQHGKLHRDDGPAAMYGCVGIYVRNGVVYNPNGDNVATTENLAQLIVNILIMIMNAD